VNEPRSVERREENGSTRRVILVGEDAVKVVLDPFRTNDAAALFEADSDPEHRLQFQFPPDFTPTIEHARRVIEQWAHERESTIRFTFAFRDSKSGQAFGGCELLPVSEAIANVSYWTRPSFRRRGVATQGVILLRQHAFRSFGFKRLEACIDLDNDASRRVALSAGFRDGGARGGRRLYLAERST
jgi:RimJ/RimL family protein N-acetyltransferase